MVSIAEIINTIINNPEKVDEVSQMVKDLCQNFKLYEFMANPVCKAN